MLTWAFLEFLLYLPSYVVQRDWERSTLFLHFHPCEYGWGSLASVSLVALPWSKGIFLPNSPWVDFLAQCTAFPLLDGYLSPAFTHTDCSQAGRLGIGSCSQGFLSPLPSSGHRTGWDERGNNFPLLGSSHDILSITQSSLLVILQSSKFPPWTQALELSTWPQLDTHLPERG